MKEGSVVGWLQLVDLKSVEIPCQQGQNSTVTDDRSSLKERLSSILPKTSFRIEGWSTAQSSKLNTYFSRLLLDWFTCRLRCRTDFIEISRPIRIHRWDIDSGGSSWHTHVLVAHYVLFGHSPFIPEKPAIPSHFAWPVCFPRSGKYFAPVVPHDPYARLPSRNWVMADQGFGAEDRRWACRLATWKPTRGFIEGERCSWWIIFNEWLLSRVFLHE